MKFLKSFLAFFITWPVTTGAILFGRNNKLGEDPSYLFWDYTNKKLSIGGSDTMTVNGTAINAGLQVHTQDGATTTEIEIHKHGDTASRGAILYGARSRGTDASPTVVQSGDTLLEFIGVGFDGTDYGTSSRIQMAVDATPGSNIMPGRIVFYTAPSSSQTLTERMRLDSSGNLGIGGTAQANALFDVISTSRGSRPAPSMTLTQRDALTSVPEGAMIYNTTLYTYQTYANGTWINNGAQTGEIISSASITAPQGFFACDGSAADRTTYANLYNAITVSKGTFTITIASPGVVTLNSHGLDTGDRVELTTTGALPTGLTEYTNYWVIKSGANTFSLATTYANALTGTSINTSGTQSGTHTLRYIPYGTSSSTGFYVPDLKGAFLRGAGTPTAFTTNSYNPLGSINNDRIQGHIHSDTIGVSTHADHDHSFPAGIVHTAGGAGFGDLDTAGAGGEDWGPAGSTNLVTDAESPNLTHTVTGAVGSPTTDGTNGTPRTGTDTRPQNVGVNYFIKY